MEFIAISKHVRQSARKLRGVASVIKKLSLKEAENKLTLLTKAASEPILKTLKSATANAINNGKIEREKLKIKNILIDEGFKIKRGDKSHGARWDRGTIRKPTAHVKVILESK